MMARTLCFLFVCLLVFGLQCRADGGCSDDAAKDSVSFCSLDELTPKVANFEGCAAALDSTVISDSLNRKASCLFLLKRFMARALEVDSNFIERNRYKVTLMSQGDWRFKLIWLRGTDEQGHSQTLYFYPHSQVTVGPYAAYSFLFFGWTIDIGSRLSPNNSNLYLSLYTPMIGVDYYYENDVNGYRFRKLRGFSDEVSSGLQDVMFPGLSTDMTYVHAYYIFNHRHFSYPAAYSQSTIQRRSSGGFILGYSYSRQVINFDYESLPDVFRDAQGQLTINNSLQVRKVRYTNHSLSLGYSVNWVFARNFLFNVTASPSIGYNFTKGERPTSDKLYRLRNVNFDFVGKLAFVWNNNRLFAGTSFTAHTYAYRKSTFSCQNALLSGQAYAGIYLWRKKKR